MYGFCYGSGNFVYNVGKGIGVDVVVFVGGIICVEYIIYYFGLFIGVVCEFRIEFNGCVVVVGCSRVGNDVGY